MLLSRVVVAALSHGSLTKVAGHIVAERHGILLASEMTSKRRNIEHNDVLYPTSSQAAARRVVVHHRITEVT